MHLGQRAINLVAELIESRGAVGDGDPGKRVRGPEFDGRREELEDHGGRSVGEEAVASEREKVADQSLSACVHRAILS